MISRLGSGDTYSIQGAELRMVSPEPAPLLEQLAKSGKTFADLEKESGSS